MIRKSIKAAAHLTAATALLVGLSAVATSEQANATAVAATPASFLLADTTGMGGNVGSPIDLPLGTVGTGGNVPA